jgi:hypothetical protein
MNWIVGSLEVRKLLHHQLQKAEQWEWAQAMDGEAAAVSVMMDITMAITTVV